MLATFIPDVFRKSEIEQMAFALDELCHPNSSYGWASAGLYCFWNVETREILYIGLAIDLAQRFRQHTGLLVCEPKCCKLDKIEAHFGANELLGFTIFVQSVMAQPRVARNAHQRNTHVKAKENGDIFWDDEGEEEIRLLEGFMIESHRKQGKIPAWNSIGGSKEGAAIKYPNPKLLLNVLNATETGPLLSRSTLRELVDNTEYEAYEEFILHVMRFNMLRLGMNSRDAFSNISDDLRIREEILRSNYLQKVPDLSGQVRYDLSSEGATGVAARPEVGNGK